MARWGAFVRSAQIVFAPSAMDLGYKVAVHEPSPPPRDLPEARPVRFRWAWWLLAYASLGLGIVGVFVPGLPTTVFILIAAYAASVSYTHLDVYKRQCQVHGKARNRTRQPRIGLKARKAGKQTDSCVISSDIIRRSRPLLCGVFIPPQCRFAVLIYVPQGGLH